MTAPQVAIPKSSQGPSPVLRRIAFIVLAILVVGYVAANAVEILDTQLDGFDESIQILGARAVGAGMLPHADFWTDYPALNYWMIAGIAKLSGDSYMIGRFLSLGLYLLVLAVAWVAAPNRRSRWWMVGGLIVTIGKFYYLPSWNAVALLLMVLLLLCWRTEDRAPAFWLVIGLLLALCLLIRVNFGAYGLLAAAATILVSPNSERRSKLLNLAALGTPAVCAVLFYCVLLRSHLPAVYAQIIDFPMHVLMKQRIRSVRLLTGGLFLIPLCMVGKRIAKSWRDVVWYAAFLLAVASAYVLDLHRHLHQPRPAFALAVAAALVLIQGLSGRLEIADFSVLLCYFLCLHYYLARAEGLHLWPALIVLSILFWKRAATRPVTAADGWELGFLAATAVLGIFLYAPVARSLIVPSRMVATRYAFQRLTHIGEPDLRMDFASRDDGLPQALNFLLRNTSPSDYVYSGLQDHARGYVNSLGVYVVLRRPIPVSDWEYEPGWSSEEPAQRLAISELERTHTQWLLLWKGEPPEKSSVRGSPVLDDYIRKTFCLSDSFGNYQVWRRCSVIQP